MRIVGCEDSYIYIDTNVHYLQISNCTNCTILVAAVNKALTLDKCEHTQVTAASNYVRVGNCVDCTTYTYSQMCPPIVFGDTRNLAIAPHNASYFEMMNHLRAADIGFVQPGAQVALNVKNQVAESIHNFSQPIAMSGLGQCFSLMQPIDFMKLSLPKKFTDHVLLLCPPEYSEVLSIRMEYFKEI